MYRNIKNILLKYLVYKIVFLLIFLSSPLLYGQSSKTDKRSKKIENINTWKVRGNYYRYEVYCSRKYKLNLFHRIKYKGGCEGNKDRRETGKWDIKNDTLIVLWPSCELQQWVLVNGNLYRITHSTKELVGSRRSNIK